MGWSTMPPDKINFAVKNLISLLHEKPLTEFWRLTNKQSHQEVKKTMFSSRFNLYSLGMQC